MIQIPNAEYAKLVGSRAAIQAALQRLADVTEARERVGEDCVPESLRNLTDADVAGAVNQARVVIAEFGG